MVQPIDNLSVFEHFGLLVVKNFLDAELCRKIRAEVRSTNDRELAEVYANKEGQYVVDETVRKTQQTQVSNATESLVKNRLMTLKPRLERHFYLSSTVCEGVNFLHYKQGGFYCPHQDNINAETDAPTLLKQRQISIIIFLNGESEASYPDCYGGGALVFYGLLKDPALAHVSVPLKGETGLLVAFPSHLFHEVESVTYGERFTIVSWFLQ
ncbi:MAG: 2OG-Fe(II) oxygenase [Cyanobacteria bacterium P01_F01_bin.150]